MKTLSTLLLLCLLSFQLLHAQSFIPFQGVARDTSGVLIPLRTLSVRLSIHPSTATGTVVYQETQSATTNNLGLFTLNIGNGTPITGAFSDINWGSGPMFVQLELDPNGGTSFTNLGTTQFQSVPYALYSAGSGDSYWTQNSGTLVMGDTTKYVGIGTAHPTATLGVNGTVSMTALGKNPHDGGQLNMDTNGLNALTAHYSDNTYSVLLLGNYNNLFHLGTGNVSLLNLDQNNNVNYGFVAMADSTVMESANGAHSNYGMFGTHDTSAYMDVMTHAGINSLTEDSDGLHWEYQGASLYTFPNNSNSGVLTNDGAGNLAWHTAAVAPDFLKYDSVHNTVYQNYQSGTNNPAGFVIESGSAVSFSSNYSHTQISAMTPSYWGTVVSVDSLSAIIINQNANGSQAICGTGSASGFPFGQFGVFHLAFNTDSSIAYGLVGTQDSTYIISTLLGASQGYGLSGDHHYSSFMDVSYAGGAHLNSFTEDSLGLHWEYQDTDRYTLPLTDGQAGQVMSTNGAGVLTWADPNTTGKAIFTPASGDTITAVWGNNIINPASGIAALTITLPSTPKDNETVYFTFTNTITALTFTGTVAAPLTGVSSISTGAAKYWLTYDSASNTWY